MDRPGGAAPGRGGPSSRCPASTLRGRPPGGSRLAAGEAIRPARPGLWPGLTAALAVAIPYAVTLLPGVGGFGDTAKLQFVGRVLGTPHQPGYPLYTMLSWAVGHLVPVGSLAWRMNLLSLVLTMAAIGLLAGAFRWLDVSPVSAVAVAVGVGLALPVWSQAVVAEVYALQLLIVTGMLYALVRWRNRRDDRWLVVTVILAGLGIANHVTIVLLLPGVSAYVRTQEPGIYRRRSTWIVMIGGAALGLVLYAYIAWRTAVPTTPYLETRVAGIGDLIRALTGQQYQSLQSELSVIPRILDQLRQIVTGTWWLLPLAVIGATRLERSSTRSLVAFWGTGMLLLVAVWRAFDTYLMVSALYVVIGLAAAHGLERLYPDRSRSATVAIVLVLVVVAAGHAPGIVSDQNRDDAAGIATMLSKLPRDAVLLTAHYNAGQYVLYYQLVDPSFADNRWTVDRSPPADALVAHLTGAEATIRQMHSRREPAPAGTPVYVIGEPPLALEDPRICAAAIDDVWSRVELCDPG